MLSQSIQDRLDSARALQLQYRPNEAVAQELRTKELIMIVSPTATGKSYLMHQVANQDAECERVRVFTTRPPRSDDQPGAFDYVPHDDAHVSQILEQIRRRELVQYMVHPTTDMVYGSELSGYPGSYNFLETISNVVTVLRLLPFASTTVIGVVVPVEQWQQWFFARYPEQSPDRTKRLQEAVTSLEWLTDSTHEDLIHWVINSAQHHAAETMIDIAKDNIRGDYGRDIALQMLEWARNELGATL